MKKVVVFAIFLFFGFTALAQQTTDVQVGDKLRINKHTQDAFEYIHFPPKNLIIKRGAIPNMKSLHAVEVVVTSVSQQNEQLIATIERADKRKFLGRYRSVKVSVEKALKAGELKS